MDDLIGWLVEQLRADEHLARATADAAGGAEWRTGPPKRCECCNSVLSTSGVEVIATDDRMTEHIALHDPAAVLADIEAKRALIEETIRPSLGNGQTTGRIAEQALRLHASAYRHRDGYRPEWGPR